MAALSSNDSNAMTSVSDAMRTRVAILVLVAAVLGGCTHREDRADDASPTPGTETGAESAPARSEGEIATEELTVVDGKLERSTWAMQSAIRGLPDGQAPEKLSGIIHAPFAGTLAPVAAPSPADENVFAYSSFARERPVLRVRDTETNEDVVVDEATYSFAWRGDGALAYFKGLNPRVPDPTFYRGHVLVRTSPTADPVRWTAKSAGYVVTAWTGDRLIVHQRQATGWPNLLVFDAPKRPRVLAKRAALIAVSPDGSRAFVTKEPQEGPAVAIVDIGTGDELASFAFSDDVTHAGGQSINYVSDSGAWTGDTVVAAVTSGVAVFDVAGDEIALEELLFLDPEVFPLGLSEPKFLDGDRYFVGAAELRERPRAAFARTALMECDRIERRCVLGRSAPAFQPPRPVYNPSRPLP